MGEVYILNNIRTRKREALSVKLESRPVYACTPLTGQIPNCAFTNGLLSNSVGIGYKGTADRHFKEPSHFAHNGLVLNAIQLLSLLVLRINFI